MAKSKQQTLDEIKRENEFLKELVVHLSPFAEQEVGFRAALYFERKYSDNG